MQNPTEGRSWSQLQDRVSRHLTRGAAFGISLDPVDMTYDPQWGRPVEHDPFHRKFMAGALLLLFVEAGLLLGVAAIFVGGLMLWHRSLNEMHAILARGTVAPYETWGFISLIVGVVLGVHLGAELWAKLMRHTAWLTERRIQKWIRR